MYAEYKSTPMPGDDAASIDVTSRARRAQRRTCRGRVCTSASPASSGSHGSIARMASGIERKQPFGRVSPTSRPHAAPFQNSPRLK